MKEQKKMTDSDNVLPDRGLRPLAILLATMTLLLIAEALVTSNEAGDSVPDWPLSFGRWLIQSGHFVANVRYEYSHRVIAASVGLVTALLAIRGWARAPALDSQTSTRGFSLSILLAK